MTGQFCMSNLYAATRVESLMSCGSYGNLERSSTTGDTHMHARAVTIVKQWSSASCNKSTL
eukprot:1354333-Alexandrium_andersonii.AAC.1